MILPVYAYGQPVLKRRATDVDVTNTALPELLANMWETMYHANGVGLAAPQIGKSMRIFLVDTIQLHDDEKDSNDEGIKVAFINAEKIEEDGEEWPYEEGCLSIPHVRGEVERPERITLKYLDGNFVEHTKTFTGMNARVIQHEYDHIDGVLFVEKLKPLKRRLISRKLDKIKKGQVSADYRLKFAMGTR
jgi:peptide deformylase